MSMQCEKSQIVIKSNKLKNKMKSIANKVENKAMMSVFLTLFSYSFFVTRCVDFSKKHRIIFMIL
jgi:hypothetical protein